MKQAIDTPQDRKDTLMFSHQRWHTARVVPQVADTDYGGGIYHGKYFALYNQARDLFLEAIGVSYFSLMNRGINLSVVQLNTRFLKPVHYGDHLMVHTRVAWMRHRSLGVEQKMICRKENTDEEILTNRMEISLVCTDASGSARAIPSDLAQGVMAYYRQ